MTAHSRIRSLLAFGLVAVACLCISPGSIRSTVASASNPIPAARPAGDSTVDLNSASEKDLDSLPGVGPATAKKIIAGRPYSSVADLSKAGVSAATIKKITPLVSVGGHPGAAASAPAKPAASRSAPASSSSAASGSLIDLNSASEKDLDSLPGVGPATAKKIIAGRPYSSVGDVSKAGVSASTLKKITPLVTVNGGGGAKGSSAMTTKSSPPMAAAAQPAPAPVPAPSPKPSAAPAAASKPAAAASNSTGSPGPGMVWVNLDSGVYHYQNSRYYGKTKNGKYLSESDAVKAGYHAAANEKKPQ